MLLEFVVPGLQISLDNDMINEQSLQHSLDEVMELEEDRLVARFSQVVKKQRHKA